MPSNQQLPTSYTIKKSPRAIHVKLKMTPLGLELTVPLKFNKKQIPSILEQHQPWIEKQFHIVKEQMAKRDILPTEITLSAIQQTWQINYIENSNPAIKLLTKPNRELVLFGNVQDKSLCRRLLLSWIREQAKTWLIPWLNRLSSHSQLNFARVSIRSQQSRWGSCSASKNISLNDKLLFLPEALVSYVLLHELCHTQHLNHSAQFWQLVAKFDPLYAQHKQALRESQSFIPAWV